MQKVKKILDESFSGSPLATVEASYDAEPIIRNNQKFFVQKVKGFHEDLTEAAEKSGVVSVEYKSLLATAHHSLDRHLPKFLDLVVLGHISKLSPW